MDVVLDGRSFLNATRVADTGDFHRNKPHITKIPLQPISKLAPFSALISSIIFVIYFAIRMYLLEGYLLKRLYGDIYTKMSDVPRRGFVNHHIAGGTKLFILIVAVYPFMDVAFGSANLNSPFAGSKYVKMGDILIIAAQALISMYVFELFYRPKISPVSAGHHIGTIMIGQAAIAISLNLVRQKDATIEFILCLVWGAFDIVAEFLPHVAIILYRVYPTRHNFLRRLFKICACTTLTGTILETIVTMWLFGTLWDRWTPVFKIVTPMLHILFASCQLWGSYNFYKMYKWQQRFLDMESRKSGDIEKSPNKPESERELKLDSTSVTTIDVTPNSVTPNSGSEIKLTGPQARPAS
ncbi:hypothetical protein BJ875DRAFT_234897 [Amylocarpus encephaloides]|uniref:Uncharacterized protein n=1 Tax=Amylocarpus encephaloides TaxID=45428 RepID=A0A9P8C0X7_9HELO|nr:hypothetical protein BJ875DRAFT_234897 [Amylocarpus encephaloides]